MLPTNKNLPDRFPIQRAAQSAPRFVEYHFSDQDRRPVERSPLYLLDPRLAKTGIGSGLVEERHVDGIDRTKSSESIGVCQSFDQRGNVLAESRAQQRQRQQRGQSDPFHRFNPPTRGHLGSFEGERKSRSSGYREADTVASALCALLAVTVFLLGLSVLVRVI